VDARQLRELSLSAIALKNQLQPLSALQELRELDLSLCEITSEDLVHLSSLTKLQELNLGNNEIQDLSPLVPCKTCGGST
jgi:hypothetical protein